MTKQRRLEFAGAFFRLRFRQNWREVFFESGDDRHTFTDYDVIQRSC